MEKKDKHRIDRREFLKRLGAGVTAVSATTVAGCSFRDAGTGGRARGEVPTDKMTYRTAPKTKEQISLLGYGCMRWPMMPSPDGTGEVIDQEAVNGLVDYALAHGVNYFDTAPPYCRGLSEKATGTALKRHPRNSYYLATKMSNHRLAGQGLSPEEAVRCFGKDVSPVVRGLADRLLRLLPAPYRGYWEWYALFDGAFFR